ncbi:hypothetical protein MPTK1_8g10990 [Marchantia polymorpha subsp. ruderalis]|uniref:Uncharacterized protein n=1 Tax=Marchantia polymorpha TaxID=3197 RepID=A0A2R6XMM9_MARPO|nr:hypothetical protein MARPO_0008s0123 [Marchantia polymorpha]BBN19476.1 hypothetical protein Mp_8g10990 [Marchantia polymorpha subsp. ruderalis]|eukprot:PTQ47354.1 hypothetical protein MARPO_0008s0123 [Marchantia polymorpha]
MTQNAQEEIEEIEEVEEVDSNDLFRFSSFNQISSSVQQSSYSINFSEGSKSFPGRVITVRRTVCQVLEEISIMEANSEKPSKSAVQKAGQFGGRILKSLFDSSPAEVVFSESKKAKEAKEAKERELKLANAKSSSSKSSSSSGSGGKPYTIASVSPPPRKPAVPVEFGGYEEPLCSPLYPVPRKNNPRQINYTEHDNFITPGIRAYPKPRESPAMYSKYSLEKESPGRSSRTTSTETSTHSVNLESEFDLSTDSTGDRTSRREKERNQQALIDRLHAEALKMKLEKAEEEMQKLRMELDVYRSENNSNTQSSVDGERRGISRINSLDDGGSYGGRQQQQQQQEYNASYGSRPEIAPLRSTLFVADEEDGKAQQHDIIDRDIGSNHWVDYQPELEILNEPPMQVDNAWRSAQMYTFLQDAAAVNTVSGPTGTQKQDRSEKKIAFSVQKVEQQSRTHSRSVSRVESPSNLQQEQQRYSQLRNQSGSEGSLTSLQIQHQQIQQSRRESPSSMQQHMSRSEESLSSLQIQHQQILQSRRESPTSMQQLNSRSEESLSSLQIQHQQIQQSRRGSPASMQQQQQQMHSVERTQSVETLSSTAQQQRHVIQRTKSTESNTSSKSNPSPRGSSIASRTRNTTIAERISRTHNVQQPMSPPQSDFLRQQQPPQSEPFQYRQQPQAELEFDRRQPQQPEQLHYRQNQQQHQHQQQQPSVSTPQQQYSDYQRLPQPELPQRQQQSAPQQEYRQQQQSHPMLMTQPLENFRQPQPQPTEQYRELQQQNSFSLQPLQPEQQRQQPQSEPRDEPGHHRSKSLTFPTMPQLSLDIKPSFDLDDASSSPLQLSPTSSGLITPTSMAPPTVFQSDAERAAYQHQKTMEKLYNARRNREAILLNNRSRPVTGGYS